MNQEQELITKEDVVQMVRQIIERKQPMEVDVETGRVVIQTRYENMQVTLTLAGVEPEQIDQGTGFNVVYRILDKNTVQITVFPPTTYGISTLGLGHKVIEVV